MTYPMHVAGLVRDLPICKVTEDFYIGAFIMFGDAELTVACARDLLKLAEELDYDYLLTAEAKSIPLIHEMARQSGASEYFDLSFGGRSSGEPAGIGILLSPQQSYSNRFDAAYGGERLY